MVHFNLGRWFLLTVGLIMAHATNNLLNDYTDYKRGVDAGQLLSFPVRSSMLGTWLDDHQAAAHLRSCYRADRFRPPGWH